MSRVVPAMHAYDGLYAYGLVDKIPQHLDLLGIDKQNAVYPVEARGICVLVSKIDINEFQDQVRDLCSELTSTGESAQSRAEEILQLHESVVDLLMKDTAVVPFKFGTVFKDEQAASQMLRDDEERFKKLLAKFAGKAEWGLKVYVDRQEFTKYVMQAEPEFKSLGEQQGKLSRGAAYLFGKKKDEEVKEHIRAQLANICEHIFQELGKDAYEAQVNETLPRKLTGKEMILNTVYLIEGEKATHFCQRGKKLKEKYVSIGLDLEVSGPWPPYSFTENWD